MFKFKNKLCQKRGHVCKGPQPSPECIGKNSVQERGKSAQVHFGSSSSDDLAVFIPWLKDNYPDKFIDVNELEDLVENFHDDVQQATFESLLDQTQVTDVFHIGIQFLHNLRHTNEAASIDEDDDDDE
ncbi:hypothetical protein ACOMHN_014844 [Nucella lapillus]